jgi:hypothetical protein
MPLMKVPADMEVALRFMMGDVDAARIERRPRVVPKSIQPACESL